MTTTIDTQQTRKTRIITLTDRPPVRIVEDDWPVTACGDYEHHDGQIRVQANRITTARMRVRQHPDGRALVYAVYEYESRWANERDVTQRVGYLLGAGDDISAAIRRTGSDLVERDVDSAIVRDLVNDCIADLPPQEL